MKKIVYISIILSFLGCKTSVRHVSDFVDKRTYSYEFKKELIKRCIYINSQGEFHKNVSFDLYGSLPPPPPFYIKQTTQLIDSIAQLKNKHIVIEECIRLSQDRKVNNIIRKEFRKEIKKESIK